MVWLVGNGNVCNFLFVLAFVYLVGMDFAVKFIGKIKGEKMPFLKVKKLNPEAILPNCAHPGSDLGIDLFSVEDVLVYGNSPTKIKTGIAVQMDGYGFVIKDRSSLASNGVFTAGGVIDAGYTGEICVLMVCALPHQVHKGDKIAQMIPVKTVFVLVEEVESLNETKRGAGGFGSTGK